MMVGDRKKRIDKERHAATEQKTGQRIEARGVSGAIGGIRDVDPGDLSKRTRAESQGLLCRTDGALSDVQGPGQGSGARRRQVERGCNHGDLGASRPGAIAKLRGSQTAAVRPGTACARGRRLVPAEEELQQLQSRDYGRDAHLPPLPHLHRRAGGLLTPPRGGVGSQGETRPSWVPPCDPTRQPEVEPVGGISGFRNFFSGNELWKSAPGR
jgi:hypothetical protein